MMTGMRDTEQHRHAVRLGAMGLVLKDQAFEVLLTAITGSYPHSPISAVNCTSSPRSPASRTPSHAARFASTRSHRQRVLLNPGPAVVSDRVHRAVGGPDLCHREPEYSDILEGVKRKLLRVAGVGDDWAVVEVGLGGRLDATNILPADSYLNFVLKFILAFGLAFLLPIFLVGLNAAGVLPARVMLRGWRPAVFLIFLFAAMMTPSPDPWSMIFLGLPMVALFFAAVGVGALLDRRRAKRDVSVAWRNLPDDQASPI